GGRRARGGGARLRRARGRLLRPAGSAPARRPPRRDRARGRRGRGRRSPLGCEPDLRLGGRGRAPRLARLADRGGAVPARLLRLPRARARPRPGLRVAARPALRPEPPSRPRRADDRCDRRGGGDRGLVRARAGDRGRARRGPPLLPRAAARGAPHGPAVGACVLLAGYAYQLFGRREQRLDAVAVVGSVVPLGLGLSAVTTLVEGHAAGIDLLGLALLGLAVVYGVLGAGAFRLHRDLSTLLWALALVVAAGAEAVLVSGGWLTLAWAGSAAALTWIAVRLEEERLQVAALAYLVVAFGWTIFEEAPPTALGNATAHPAKGIGSVALVAGA